MAYTIIKASSHEIGDTPFLEQKCCAHSIRYMTGGQNLGDGFGAAPAVRDGGRIARYLRIGGDTLVAGGYRAEHQFDDHAGEGQRTWRGWSTYIPTNWNQGSGENSFRIIRQDHEGGGRSPSYSMHLNTVVGRLTLRRKTLDNGGTDVNFSDVWNIAIPPPGWIDFVENARWSHTSTGRYQLKAWSPTLGYDNTVVFNQTASPTFIYGPSTHNYSKQGTYGGRTLVYGDWVRTAFVDDDADYTAIVKTPTPGDPDPGQEPPLVPGSRGRAHTKLQTPKVERLFRGAHASLDDCGCDGECHEFEVRESGLVIPRAA